MKYSPRTKPGSWSNLLGLLSLTRKLTSGNFTMTFTECISPYGSGTVPSMPCSLAGASHNLNSNDACICTAWMMAVYQSLLYTWTTCWLCPPMNLRPTGSNLSLNPPDRSLPWGSQRFSSASPCVTTGVEELSLLAKPLL